MEKTKRITFLDILKAIAIFLVIWGHSLEHIRAVDMDHHILNCILDFIFSFHMPVFFIISGFFFKSSLKKPFKEFATNKFLQLLIPLIVWALIYNCISLIYTDSHVDFISALKELLTPRIGPLWFLISLFISYFLMYVFYKLIKKEYLVILASLVFVLIIPKGLAFQRTFLPMFIFGIIVKNNFTWIVKNRIKLLLISLSIFSICLVFWKGTYTVYYVQFPAIINLGISNLSSLYISIFRLLIGLAGSLFFILLFSLIEKQNSIYTKLQYIGRQTLAIYILQTLFFKDFIYAHLLHLDFSGVNTWLYNLVITPAISIAVLIVCLYITRLINKSKTLSLLLLGKV